MDTLKLIFAFSLILIAGCHEAEPPQVPPPPVDITVPTIIPTGDEKYLNTDSDYIFDQQKLATYELILPPESLAQLNNNPAAEQYVEGSLIFEGDTLSPVGIRYKGSIGGFVGCVSGSDWSNPSGYKTCTKLSMKVKINWDGSDAKFYKLKKLQFHSMNLDPTQMRDRLGYWLFREMGVPAPRCVHARLLINGTYSGLYALVEQIDGRFTRYNFDEGKGNLYKEIWPLNSSGQPQTAQTFLTHLETNEGENPTVDLIRTFATEVATSNSTNLKQTIAMYMDVDEIISYAVVDRTIRNDDGAFHWYCGNGQCSNHNFYWYEEPEKEKLHLIPWDLDNAFENIVSNQNPVTPIADDWGMITAGCNIFKFGQFQFEQRSAACDKLTAGWVRYENEYTQTLTQFKNGPLSIAQANARLDEWTSQIRSATTEASQAHSDALKVSSWEANLNSLKASLAFARTR